MKIVGVWRGPEVHGVEVVYDSEPPNPSEIEKKHRLFRMASPSSAAYKFIVITTDALSYMGTGKTGLSFALSVHGLLLQRADTPDDPEVYERIGVVSFEVREASTCDPQWGRGMFLPREGNEIPETFDPSMQESFEEFRIR